MNQKLIDAYLDFRNNYLSVKVWAEHNGFNDVKDAEKILQIGHKLHEERAAFLKSLQSMNKGA